MKFTAPFVTVPSVLVRMPEVFDCCPQVLLQVTVARERLTNFVRGLFEMFFRVFRASFAENRGDSDLCLKTTRKFRGDLRKTAKCSKISRNPQKKTKTELKFSAREISYAPKQRLAPHPDSARLGA